jgi:hypothetical protein
MKVNRSLRSILLTAIAVVGIVLLITSPTSLSGQVSNLRPHGLAALTKAFEDYHKDFREMEEASHDAAESEILGVLDQAAMTAEDRLGAATVMLQMYGSLSSSLDRAKVKPILKKELAMYSWLFDQETTRTAGALTFVKAPAAAQMGLRMKDDLRASKEQLEAIESSLD